MEIFYSDAVDSSSCHIGQEESVHLVRVLRHKEGDRIFVIDGIGNMYKCVLVSASVKGSDAEIEEVVHDWGGHCYTLTLAVCPTKNMDRYEWFAEKATEIGVDRIIPLIGERSERRVMKTDRLKKILLSAAKQSLKAKIPDISEPVGTISFFESLKPAKDELRLIAYCFDGEKKRISIKSALNNYNGNDITVLIGPEGDFSPEEVSAAISSGFVPVHLGASRLRTETAALTAVEAVYFKYLD